MSRRQVVLSRNNLPPGPALQFEARTLGNPASGAGGLLVCRQSNSLGRFRDLPRGQFCQSRKDEFGLAHVIAQILRFKPFDVFVLLDRDAGPFPVNEIRENGKLTPCLTSCAAQ